MLSLQKPRPLRPGSRVAVVSPSWGGPGAVPHRYGMGIRELRDRFALEVVEMPHATADPDWLWRHPEARADDLNAAFEDPSIEGIIATIGGDDAVRLLPYLDGDAMRRNPKVFLGYSDTTVLHVFALLHGLQTFYGPSVMAGIAENGGMLSYTEAAFRRALMSASPIGALAPAAHWTAERIPWEDVGRSGERRRMQPNRGWSWHGGSTRVRGHLVGGCLEVLEFLKGTPWWPPHEVWDGGVFYWELYQDEPDIDFVRYWLRNYGMQGILGRLAGMLVGRLRNDDDDVRGRLTKAIESVVAVEFDRPDLPIVLGLDFGHTDPQTVLPNGGRVDVDPGERSITLPG